jgi:hypothetical protein
VGGRKPPPGEPLRIVASQPYSAQGLDCELDAGVECGLDPSAPLRFKFNDWLLPTTAIRQSVSLYTEGTELGVFLRPDYDVTARVLNYRPDTPLAPGAVYELRIPDADQDPNGLGFRSYDGRSLDTSYNYAFRTSIASQASPPNDALPAVTCDQVLSALDKAGCASANCHGGNLPRMGLSLQDAAGLLSTAIDHVAHETELGTDVSEPVVSGGRFGTQMPVIDSGRPENSYLMYKLLIGSGLNRELGELANDRDPFAPGSLSSAAIEQARAYFLELGAMPPDSVGYPSGVSPSEVVTTLQSWTRSGAVCP